MERGNGGGNERAKGGEGMEGRTEENEGGSEGGDKGAERRELKKEVEEMRREFRDLEPPSWREDGRKRERN